MVGQISYLINILIVIKGETISTTALRILCDPNQLGDHYGKPVIRRVPKSSPCANHRAHGEESLCRGPNTEHTAKIKHTAKGGFAVCPNLNTRQTYFFALCHRPAHGKDSATWPDVHGRSTPSYFAMCLR